MSAAVDLFRETEDLKRRLTAAYLEIERERAARMRLERILGEGAVEVAKLRSRLDRYEPRPEVEISTLGT